MKLKYLRPSTCYNSSGIYFDKDFNIRTTAVQNLVVEDPNCKTLVNNSINTSLNFFCNE